MTPLEVSTTDAGVRFETRVTPRASKNAIDGVREGRLLIKVTAPPVDAAANAAVIELLADALDVAKRHITLVAGERSRVKRFMVAGLTEPDLRQRLRIWSPGASAPGTTRGVKPSRSRSRTQHPARSTQHDS